MLRLTLLFALASLAFAQPRRGGPALQLLDTDKDGIISAADWKNAPAALAKLQFLSGKLLGRAQAPLSNL